MVYELLVSGSSLGEFNSKEEAEAFAERRIEAMKTFCGCKYIMPYEIKEKWGFNHA